LLVPEDSLQTYRIPWNY